MLLDSIDLLNSYVRSDSCREHWNAYALRKAVYTYKTEYLRVFVPRVLPECFVVRSIVKCRDCDGTGRYTDSYGYQHDHCWACNSRGKAELRFVETTWPTGQIWHTPVMKWPWFLDLIQYDTYNGMPHRCPWATNYTPNQPGRDAGLRDVILALQAVEEWYWESGETQPPKIDCYESTSWGGSVSARAFLGYKLNIGYRKTCPLCGCEITPESNASNHLPGGHPYLDWGEPVCEDCYETNKDRIWDLLRQKIVPPELCNADVMLFLRTHGRIVERHMPAKIEREIVWS